DDEFCARTVNAGLEGGPVAHVVAVPNNPGPGGFRHPRGLVAGAVIDDNSFLNEMRAGLVDRGEHPAYCLFFVKYENYHRYFPPDGLALGSVHGQVLPIPEVIYEGGHVSYSIPVSGEPRSGDSLT